MDAACEVKKSYVNDTCGAQEKTSVEGVDAIVKMALHLIARASSAEGPGGRGTA